MVLVMENLDAYCPRCRHLGRGFLFVRVSEARSDVAVSRERARWLGRRR